MDLRWLCLALLGCASAGCPTMFGKITSPNYPRSYPNNANETWDIQVPEGYGIRLYFIYLDMGPSENCENNSLKVISADKVQQTLCNGHLVGSAGIPKDKKYYPTTLLKLVFTSDASKHESFNGFSAYYTAVDVDECEDVQPHPCSHACHNYIGGYFCSCPQRYVLQEDQHTCEPLSCENPPTLRYGQYTFLTKPYNGMYKASVIYNCTEPFYTMVTQTGSAKFICSEDREWRDENGGNQIPHCAPVCGVTSLEHISRIFGGSEAKDGNFPWVVHIESDTVGGGALITDRWVLTAASLVQYSKNPTVKVGSWRLAHAKKMQSKKVILHPKWTVEDNEQRKNYDNDIALIQLSKRVELGPCLYPVCLPQKGGGNSPAVGEVGYVAGWGRTEKRQHTQRLQYANGVFRDTEECRTTVVTDQAFTANMVCAGGFGKDSCVGDNGGPLMFEDLTDQTANTKLYITGIVSWGIECGKFGMYTKVENYLDWIKETIEEVEREEDVPNTEPVKVCPVQ